MKAARISFGYALIVEWFVTLQIMPNILLHIPQQSNLIQKFCQLWQMTSVESNHYLHAAEIHFTSDLEKVATGFPLCMYHAHTHAQDLWRCEPLCAPLNKSKKSCICFLSCLSDSILLRRNGFYINFSCCRFLCPAYHFLSISVSAALFLLIIFIWKQRTVLYCWFLCGSSKISYCWFLCDNNEVSISFYAWPVGWVRCWVGIWRGCAWMMKCYNWVGNDGNGWT